MIRRIIFLTLTITFLSGCALSDFNRDNFVKTSSSAGGGYIGYYLSDEIYFLLQ